MRITCRTGGEVVYVSPGDPLQDAHLAMDAHGCTHHLDEIPPGMHPGLLASSCSRAHDGPCWRGPASGERPEGCTVTRPLIIEPFGEIGLPAGTMTDQNRVNSLMQALFTSSSNATVTAGTGGGSGVTMTPPLYLRLITGSPTVPTNTTNGSELSGTGYTAGGATMGSSAFGTPSGAVQTNVNAVSWSVGSSWATIPYLEIWDSAGTKLRWLFGSLTSSITGAANGDTVQFAAASISISGASW